MVNSCDLEVLARLVNITAPQVKGAHDTEIALAGDCTRIVRTTECAGERVEA